MKSYTEREVKEMCDSVAAVYGGIALGLFAGWVGCIYKLVKADRRASDAERGCELLRDYIIEDGGLLDQREELRAKVRDLECRLEEAKAKES